MWSFVVRYMSFEAVRVVCSHLLLFIYASFSVRTEDQEKIFRMEEVPPLLQETKAPRQDPGGYGTEHSSGAQRD